MAWSSWFKKPERRSAKPAPRRSRVRLGVETLEDRTTPSTTTTLVSVALPTTAGSASSLTTTSSGASFSSDENLFVFASDASNLVANDTNGVTDVFVANLSTGAITRVSVTATGQQLDGPSFFPSISSDGLTVAFQSYATNLVTGDTNGTADIFVKTLASGAVKLLSADANGVLGNNFSSLPAISADGAYVVFSSFATNLSANDTDAVVDVYRKNVATGAIDVVSRSAAGVKGDQASSNPAISADGRYVAFATSATNLLPASADNNGKIDIYRKDMSTGAIVLVSGSASNVIGTDDSVTPNMSADGNVIAFTSAATNLVTGDTNAKNDVFAKNITTGAIARVSVANDGSQLTTDSSAPSITTDGTKVSFVSAATTVVTGDTNAVADVFVRDTTAGTTTRTSTQAGGAQSAGGGDGGRLSPSGVKLAYFTGAADLNSTDTNGLFDVYVKNRTSGAVTLISQGTAALVAGDNNSFLSASTPQLSADGVSVVFVSSATNLVTGTDANGNFRDVYMRDLSQSQTIRISSSSAGVQSNGDSTTAAFNPSGAAALVAFSTTASNLVTGDTQTFEQVYLKDPFTGGVAAVSRTSAGIFGNGDSYSPVMSASGQYVAFITLATNLVTDTTATSADVVVLNRTTGAFTLVSATAAGVQVAGTISGLSMSDDGKFVAFATDAALDPSDTNGKLDVYVKNLTTGALTLISKTSAGTVGNGASGSPVISADGKYIAFASEANNLIANDVNNSADIYRSDWQTGTNGALALVSVKADGVQANGTSGNTSMSEDGRFIAFGSDASNLVANDTNSASDVFIKDMTTGTVYLASQNSLGQIGNAGSLAPSISRDGRTVAFASVASNLTSLETNSLQNVYLTVVNHTPTIAGTGATTIALGQSLSIDLSTTTDVDNDTLSYTWDINNDGTFGDVTGSSFTLTAAQLATFGITAAGTYHAKVKVTDAYSPTVLNFDITVTNTTGPVATITPGAIGTNEGGTASFTGSATGTGTITLAWSVTRNGAAFTTGTGAAFTFNITDNGAYIVTLTATDGNNVTGTTTSNFTVNNVAPAITALNAPASGVEGTAISFTPTVTDASSLDQTAGFTFSWTVTKNGSDYTSGSGSVVAFTPNDNGSYAIDVTAKDKDNGVSAVSSATINVTNVAPTLNVAASATVNEGSTYTLTFSANDPGTDTISSWVINWGDGSANQTLAGTATSATHVYADGPASWTLTATATDEDGSYSKTQAITVNDVAPTASVTGNATVLVNTVYSLNLGALVDPGQDPLTSAVINWGDSTTTTVPANGFGQTYQHTYTTAANFTIQVSATNGDGTFQLGTVAVQSHIDPPTIAISGPNTVAEGSTYTLQLGAITNNASQTIDGYRIAWGDGVTADVAGLPPATLTHVYADGTASRTITLSLLSGSTPYVNPASKTVSVTDVAPTATLTAPSSVAEGTSFTLNVALTDPGADTVSTYTLNWGDGQSDVVNSSVPATLTHTYANEAASRTITLTVTNEDGTFTAGTTTLQVTNVAPTFEAGADANLLEGGGLTRNGSFTDTGSDTWTATVDYGDGAGPQALALSGKTYVLSKTYNQQGTFLVTVKILDGTATTTDSFSVIVANVLPAVTAGSDTSIAIGGTLTRSGSFTDPGNDAWSATVDYGDGSAVAPLALSGKTFSLNHTYSQAGQFTVRVTVTDDTGSGSSTFLVTASNAVPAITLPTTATLSEAGTLTASGSFTDADSQTWTATVDYGLGQGAIALPLSGKTFSLSKVYPKNGTYTVTVAINDGTGTSTAPQTVTVNNIAPTISAGAAATVATGGTFTRSGSFVDPGDNTWTATVNYGDGAGAVALTLNADKTFSLSHTYNTAGTFPVTIIVNDGTTPTTATFNVSVAPLTLALSANTVIEQSAAGAVIGALSTGNTALDTSATFTLLDNAGGRFALNGRNLVVSNGALLNVTAATSHSVNVRVTNGTATFDKTFPIQVVTGDKGDDFIGRDPITGQIFVARSTGSGFVTTNYQGGFTPTKNWVDILTGDFDGNGFDDVVGRDAATGQWSLAKNTGTTFVLSPWTTWSATATWVDVMAADMNGDGKIDVIGRNRATGEWICAFSQGTTAGSEIIGKWDPTKTWVQVKAIDVNHDNRTDVVGLQAGTGKFFTSLNQTSTTIVGGAKLNNLTSPWANLTDGNLESRTTWVDVQMADIDGDGRIDYVGRVLATAQWYVSYGTNGKPTPAKSLTAWNRTIAYAPTFIADVNGDGKADLIGRTQATGQWLVGVAPVTRGAAVITTNRGAPGYFYTDVFVGDFNHDGKTDIAGIRTGSGVWTVGLSTGTDFLFGDWDLWPTTNSRITIRRARVAN